MKTQSLIRSSTMTELNVFQSEDCPICVDSINLESTAVLNCGHVFHRNCVYRCFNVKLSCPICRANVVSAQIRDTDGAVVRELSSFSAIFLEIADSFYRDSKDEVWRLLNSSWGHQVAIIERFSALSSISDDEEVIELIGQAANDIIGCNNDLEAGWKKIKVFANEFSVNSEEQDLISNEEKRQFMCLQDRILDLQQALDITMILNDLFRESKIDIEHHLGCGDRQNVRVVVDKTLRQWQHTIVQISEMSNILSCLDSFPQDIELVFPPKNDQHRLGDVFTQYCSISGDLWKFPDQITGKALSDLNRIYKSIDNDIFCVVESFLREFHQNRVSACSSLNAVSKTLLSLKADLTYVMMTYRNYLMVQGKDLYVHDIYFQSLKQRAGFMMDLQERCDYVVRIVWDAVDFLDDFKSSLDQNCLRMFGNRMFQAHRCLRVSLGEEYVDRSILRSLVHAIGALISLALEITTAEQA